MSSPVFITTLDFWFSLLVLSGPDKCDCPCLFLHEDDLLVGLVNEKKKYIYIYIKELGLLDISTSTRESIST